MSDSPTLLIVARMPEGPEIRQAADKVQAAIMGHELVAVVFTPDALRDRAEELLGEHVAIIETRGKAMLTRFSNGLVMYSHNQLYGRWYVSALPKRPQTRRSLRVSLQTKTHVAELYSATDIALFDERDILEHPFLRNVGPDILNAKTKVRDIAELLTSNRFAGRALANFYLEQSFVAGIGNYLRSEIFFCARVAPTAKPRDLSAPAVLRLATETRRVSRRAYKQSGVTVTNSLMRRLKLAGVAYRDYRHFVFDREGGACYNCDAEIRRVTMAGRQLFYCPSCQSGED